MGILKKVKLWYTYLAVLCISFNTGTNIEVIDNPPRANKETINNQMFLWKEERICALQAAFKKRRIS